MNLKTLISWLSICIGICFLLSGIGKSIDIVSFSNTIAQYGFPIPHFVALIVCIFEIAIALLFIFRIHILKVTYISIAFIIIATAIYVYGVLSKDIQQCGCFGVLQSEETSPILVYVRNALLAITIVYVGKHASLITRTHSRITYIILASALVVLCGISIIIQQTKTVAIETNSNHYLLNGIIDSTFISPNIHISKDKTYIVFCFSYSCPHCIESIRNLQDYKRHGLVDSVIAMTYPNQKNKDIFSSFFSPDFVIHEIPKTTLDSIATVYPTTFFISGNTIHKVILGELQSPYTEFKKQYTQLKNKEL